MKRFIAPLLLLLLALPCLSFAALQAPEDGIWGDPAAPGSGFVIELQNATMAVSAFTYTTTGTATWFLATGPFDSRTLKFTANAVNFVNGQCLGCAYRAPASGGGQVAMEIRFSSLVAGTVFINGQAAYDIRRNYYAYATPDDFILGGWSPAYYSIGGSLSGHALRMESKIQLSNGPGVQGRIDTETRPAIGSFVASAGKYLVLVDSSTSFYVAYVFDFTKNFWFGEGYLYRKTESIADAVAKPSYAARIVTKAALDTLTKAGQAGAEAEREARHWREYDATKQRGADAGAIVLDGALIDGVRVLEDFLEHTPR